MSSDQTATGVSNPWPRIGWWFTAITLTAAFLLGFVVLGRYQPGRPALNLWAAMCRAIGIPTGQEAVAGPQPTLFVPTRIAWTPSTMALIESGNPQRGEFVALNCEACHGGHGASPANLAPQLDGLDSAVIYKELDDFRSGKRAWGVMNAIAMALSAQDSAAVAAYYARREGGLAPVAGESLPTSGRSLRQRDTTIRLVYAGDPHRGIPPCASCHGPGGHKFGAPTLMGQQRAYLERQLLAFAQGVRRNDMNRQMRTVAEQLTPEEVDGVSAFYSSGGSSAPVGTRVASSVTP